MTKENDLKILLEEISSALRDDSVITYRGSASVESSNETGSDRVNAVSEHVSEVVFSTGLSISLFEAQIVKAIIITIANMNRYPLFDIISIISG